MIEDIRALYAEKQKQYQDYLVEKRVHEQNLRTATDNLLQGISTIKKTLEGNDSNLAARILEVLNKCNSAEDLQSGATISQLIMDLKQISSELETEIREALS